MNCSWKEFQNGGMTEVQKAVTAEDKFWACLLLQLVSIIFAWS